MLVPHIAALFKPLIAKFLKPTSPGLGKKEISLPYTRRG